MEGELPSIDDLEVAAAAAGVAPVPAVLAEMGYFELGLQPAAAAEVPQDSLSDDSGDEAESSSDEDPDASHESAAGIVRLLLRPLGGGQDGVSVRLLLVGGGPRGTAAAAGMEVEEVADDSGFSSSASSGSSSDDEASSASADEPLDVIQNYSELRQMIDDMDADVDADEDGGGGAAAAHRAERELLGSLPLPALAGVQVSADEAVQAAGIVLSMLEGMVVAQAGSRALNEGCVLVLEDRSPIGCVEEIFGPVVSPLYALRYGGAEPMPAALQPGATVYSVDRLADFVLPEQLRVQGYDAAAEEEEADLEAQFSDDEAEARHRRKLEAKRKQQPEGLVQGGRGPKQAQGGRGRGGRGGGRGGRGGGGRGSGQHPSMGGPKPMQPSPQQQQPGSAPAAVAYYHPHQQMPPAGRVFSGQLPRPSPPAAFQVQAAAAQFNGMSLQQQQQQGMYMQPPPPGSWAGAGSGGGYYGGGQPAPPRMTGQVLRPQYAVPPQQRPPGTGAIMQPQYAGQAPGMQAPQQAQQAQQAQHQLFTPQFRPPPPPQL
ncbi:hypothetical protein CHLNCDRAFT_136109 [Chlorella variabilis]|uniref:H/ACA ribonucleoprotein complex non-core subunit NAF1 n=1 Tax=Chlorella variabilis TaxID=554065 RepID=E1ZJS1_CHLVA|nr:hypothetical protein CHLNCDRAFT_136109 [Chlorella variabilis]EFN54041.1 hypothetical protein CHLNCDRAFT_136109 [Chlorella variabilis]|eukprot:XP_005846143.1 hypothetical protein CHLNCDRAFT_136109 [Chlorella variabilis]